MAERRMFTNKVVGSDAFTEMPATAQILYIHLNMNADDDGFVNNPKKIARSIGSTVDDLDLLIKKRFLIRFPSGVVVIKHWLMHNSIKKDRYKPTEYQDEFSQLYIKVNKSYTEVKEHAEIPRPEPEWIQNGAQMEPEWIQNGSSLEPQDRKGKDRLGKDRIGKYSSEGENDPNSPKIKHPTLQEIKDFCESRGSPVDPNRFYDFFEAGNWIDTKGNPVKNWKQKLITWERKEVERNGGKSAADKPVSGEGPVQHSDPKAPGYRFKYDNEV